MKGIEYCYFTGFVLILDLLHLKDRMVNELSGGELQRFAIAIVCIQKADV